MKAHIHKALLRYRFRRAAQWVYKTEPDQFSKVDGIAPSCPACEIPATHVSDYPSSVRPFANHCVHYCSTCGLGFVAGMRDLLRSYYEDDYATSNRRDREQSPEGYFANLSDETNKDLARYRHRVLRQIELLTKFGAKMDSVLDYGSGPGYFLKIANPARAHAIEPDEHSHKYLASLGAKIFGGLDDLEDQTFDTIVASHALEHLPAEDLQFVVSRLLAALKQGGRLLVEVPQGGHSYLHLAGGRQDPHTLFFTGQSLVKSIERAKGKIVFQQALGRVESPNRSAPIYEPVGPPFFVTGRGSLTVICERAG